MDEADLLANLAGDLDAAFETLVRLHQDRVYTIALRMIGDPSEAEDAAQDAFIRAYRALAGWDARRIRDLRLSGWLATIAMNAARTRIRARRTTARASLEFLDELEHPVDEGRRPDEQAARREAVDAWAGRLLAIPERYRAPVVLRHVDGLGYDEIAEALALPEGTVKAQVHRGLGLLRALLEAEARAEPNPPTSAAGLPVQPAATPPPPHLEEVSR